MSVENFSRPDNGALEMLPHPPERCFYCGGIVGVSPVFVQGQNGAEIVFHADCALPAAVELRQAALSRGGSKQ